MNVLISDDDFAKIMQECADIQDQDHRHRAMDAVLCEFLRGMGYNKTIDIFDNTPKWYA